VGLLLCDLDNTLVDRGAAFRRWATAFAAGHGHGDELVAWLVEIDGDGFGPRPEFFVRIHERLGLASSVDDLVADYYRDFLPQFRTDDDVRAALGRARAAGWRLAIVTNGPPTQLDKIHHAGLDDLVDVWCISDVEGTRKPDARLLELAAERTGVALAHAWMIGDNPDADVGAAVAAGIRSVWLRHGRSWPRDDFAPTAVADTFGEAVDIALRGSGALSSRA
jgi:putative hydrolase of the HAD superfamily